MYMSPRIVSPRASPLRSYSLACTHLFDGYMAFCVLLISNVHVPTHRLSQGQPIAVVQLSLHTCSLTDQSPLLTSDLICLVSHIYRSSQARPAYCNRNAQPAHVLFQGCMCCIPWSQLCMFPHSPSHGQAHSWIPCQGNTRLPMLESPQKYDLTPCSALRTHAGMI